MQRLLDLKVLFSGHWACTAQHIFRSGDACPFECIDSAPCLWTNDAIDDQSMAALEFPRCGIGERTENAIDLERWRGAISIQSFLEQFDILWMGRTLAEGWAR
jgi:hypothetical protein